jgi:hypothetical protein
MKFTTIIILFIAAAVLCIWLSFWILPYKGVVTLGKKSNVANLHGTVLGHMSSNHKLGIRNRSSTVQIDSWRNIDIVEGWDVIREWWPFTLLIFAATFPFGLLIGGWAQNNEFRAAADLRIQYAELKVKFGEDMYKIGEMWFAEGNEAVEEKMRIQRDASRRITAVEERIKEEHNLRLEAEKKTDNMRVKHKEEGDKAAARINELKNEKKKIKC